MMLCSASLGGAAAAAHTALMAVAWLCFFCGDVGSSLAQAFLPPFATRTRTRRVDAGAGRSAADADDADAADGGGALSFDTAAAWPTLRQLLRCTLMISASVVAMASTMLAFGAPLITADPSVQQQMRAILPFMVATLSTHGMAVTLEGVLLARKALRALALTYTGVGLSCAALLALVRRTGAGLAGVWCVYIWYCAVRVVAFASLGGLLPSASSKREL